MNSANSSGRSDQASAGSEAPKRKKAKLPPVDSSKLPHVPIYTLSPYKCLDFNKSLRDFAKGKEFMETGALIARLPPELYLGGSFTDLEKLDKATVTVKLQSIKYGRMTYTEENNILLSDFFGDAKELDQETDTKALLEQHMFEGRSIFSLASNWGGANYASDVTNMEVMDRALKGIHPDDWGRSVFKLNSMSEAPGITANFAYFGAAKSTFCIHTENAGLNSVNILVEGAPKVWLVCAPQDAPKVDALLARKMKKPCHHSYEKTVLVTPQDLIKEGITVHQIVQRKGDMVVTAPNAYHLGFNSGLNVAVSANTVLEIESWREAVTSSKTVICPENPCSHCSEYDGLDIKAMLEVAKTLDNDQLFSTEPSSAQPEKVSGEKPAAVVEKPAATSLAATDDYQQGSIKNKTKRFRWFRQNLRKKGILPPVVRGSKERKVKINNLGSINCFNYIIRNKQQPDVVKFLQKSQKPIAKHMRGEFEQFSFAKAEEKTN